MQAQFDTGQIKNHLGLFTDSGLTRLDTGKFIRLGSYASMTKKELARILGISRPKIYQKEALVSKNDVKNRLIQLVYVTDLLYELNNRDKQKVTEWVMTPNHLFFNASPFQMILGGKAEAVIDKIHEWLDIDFSESRAANNR